jgi:polysaccharide deacetylase family protein (PEP-CTERM system associated)
VVSENKIVNALSIDVEDYFHATALSGAIERSEWDSADSRVERNTRWLLESFSRRNIKATFFVLGWVAERFPHLVREIAEAGHEIGSHGYSHKLIYNQTPEEFREETLRSKQFLEDTIGAPVTGYRAASFSITPKSEWAIDILIEAGFEYDSSLYPISHDLYGDKKAPRHPFVRRGSNGGSIVELPLSTLKLLGQRIPVGGGGYFRLFPYWFLRWALARVNRTEGQPFIFYLHPWEVDVDQPRMPVKGFSRFRHYNNLEKSEERLNRLLDDFQFSTCRDLLQDWNERQQANADG